MDTSVSASHSASAYESTISTFGISTRSSSGMPRKASAATNSAFGRTSSVKFVARNAPLNTYSTFSNEMFFSFEQAINA